MAQQKQPLDVEKALGNLGEVMAFVPQNYDPSHVTATHLEEIDDLLEIAPEFLEVLRRRREEASVLAGKVTTPSNVVIEETQLKPRIRKRSDLEVARTSLILGVLERANGLPLPKEVFNVQGYNELAPGVTSDANNKAFRKIMRKLIDDREVVENPPGFFARAPQLVEDSDGEDTSFLALSN